MIETVRAWLVLRENADAEGAARLSTSDIVVRTPLGAVSGIDSVKAQIYTSSSPVLISQTELEANKASPGVWTVRRNYSVSKAGTNFTLRQDWLVVQRLVASEASPGKARRYESLIAEVTSTIA